MTSSPRDGLRRSTGNPLIEKVETNLRRGNFLRGDERSLVRILEEDLGTVTRLGLDLEAFTARMVFLYQEGRNGLGAKVCPNDRFEVTVREDRGILPCPWDDHFAAPKAIIECKNLRNNKRLTFSALGLHLIQVHGFFQGRGSPFRIEPQDLRDFFS